MTLWHIFSTIVYVLLLCHILVLHDVLRYRRSVIKHLELEVDLEMENSRYHAQRYKDLILLSYEHKAEIELMRNTLANYQHQLTILEDHHDD